MCQSNVTSQLQSQNILLLCIFEENVLSCGNNVFCVDVSFDVHVFVYAYT